MSMRVCVHDGRTPFSLGACVRACVCVCVCLRAFKKRLSLTEWAQSWAAAQTTQRTSAPPSRATSTSVDEKDYFILSLYCFKPARQKRNHLPLFFLRSFICVFYWGYHLESNRVKKGKTKLKRKRKCHFLLRHFIDEWQVHNSTGCLLDLFVWSGWISARSSPMSLELPISKLLEVYSSRF